eukprot:Gb_00275 [translate_table: standard]
MSSVSFIGLLQVIVVPAIMNIYIVAINQSFGVFKYWLRLVKWTCVAKAMTLPSIVGSRDQVVHGCCSDDNGSPRMYICMVNGLPFNKYTWLMTHNAFAITEEPSHTGTARYTFDNQEDTVTDQLNMVMMEQYQDPVRTVQHLIKKCLMFDMDCDDCVEVLAKHAKIKPIVTLTENSTCPYTLEWVGMIFGTAVQTIVLIFITWRTD